MAKIKNKAWVFVSIVVFGVILVMLFNKYSNETYRTRQGCPDLKERLQNLEVEKAKLVSAIFNCDNRGPLDDTFPIPITRSPTRGEPIRGRFFDPIAYANRYIDLKKAFGYDTRALTNHWLSTGIREQRNGAGSESCGKFNPAVYARINGLKGMDYYGIMSHYKNVGVTRRLNYC